MAAHSCSHSTPGRGSASVIPSAQLPPLQHSSQ
uniref:Uncharacterized protein n=1 Tax=Anguilla anguilla TaxID=7936 RepID=A0A0E9VN67_ANGAN